MDSSVMPHLETPTDRSAEAPDVSPAALAPYIAIGASLAFVPPANSGNEQDSAALGLLTEVTHDLRSPLSSMLVLIEQIRTGQSGPLTRQQQLQLGLLYEATLEISNLTQNALELVRPSAGTTVASSHEISQEFSIAQAWASVRALVAPIAQERGLTLRWAGPEHDIRRGQPELLQRVLLNLVTNALKFTSRGSISVTAQEVSAQRVRFRVRDTGSGLTEPARQLVGNLNSDIPHNERPSRSLGLSMCASFLKTVGSRLELGANDGPGTCIEFELHLPQGSQRL